MAVVAVTSFIDFRQGPQEGNLRALARRTEVRNVEFELVYIGQ